MQQNTQTTLPQGRKRARHTALPRFSWRLIALMYCLYVGIIIGGYAVGRNTQILGALAFLAVIMYSYGRALLRIPRTPLALLVIVSFLLPLIPLLASPPAATGAAVGFLVKYYAVYLLILLGLCLPLTPLNGVKERWWIFAAILLMLMLGALSHDYRHTADSDQLDRVKGMFANPNNYALTALCLLSLLNGRLDHPYLRAAVNLVVIALVYISGTSGALMGYVAGCAMAIVRSLRSPTRVVKVSLALLLVVVVCCSIIPPSALLSIKPVQSAMAKIQVANENIPLVLAGKKIHYGPLLKQAHGRDLTSGIWRLEHWRNTLMMLGNGTPLQVMFGYGIGTSDKLLGTKPHNEYLRFLFELGIVGLLIHLAIWTLLYRRLAPNARWLMIMLAVYSFTENNFDNFLVISLFFFFVTSVRELPALAPAVSNIKHGARLHLKGRLSIPTITPPPVSEC